MIFFLAYEFCCVDKMKLFSSILASALVIHLVHSIVIKINPIRVQVRPKHAKNTSTSCFAPFSKEISTQLRITTDKLVSSTSFESSSTAKNQVSTDLIVTGQSLESIGRIEIDQKMSSNQHSVTESSAEYSTTSNLNVTKHFFVTESRTEYQISASQMVTLKPAENVSTFILITTNQSVTKEGFEGDNSSRHVTDKLATKESTFEHEVYTKTHSTEKATSKSLKTASSCKIAYPISSPASKDEPIPQNGTSISELASTVALSSVKSSTQDIHADVSPEATNETNSENFTKGLENADESQAISSSSHSISTHFSSSVSDKSYFPTLSLVDSSSTVYSEVQISAPQSVKTATPHSEGYPDFENKNEIFDLDSSTSKKSTKDQEVNEITYSSADAASQNSSNENFSAASKIASVSPLICNITKIIKSQTVNSISSVTEDSKLQKTIGENTKYSDSSRNTPPQNSKSDQQLLTSVPLEGEEDQIVSTIESYSFQESVTASSTAENKLYTSPSKVDDKLTVQNEQNTSTEIITTVHIQETTQPNQLKSISSIGNIWPTAKPSADTQNTTWVGISNNQSRETSESSFPMPISTAQSSAANVSENYTTAFHRLTESSRATDFGPGNLSSSATVSSRATCKTTNANHSWCGSKTCKTVLVQRTTTPRALTEEEKKIRRLTISNKNPNLAKKLTKVTPLKGNISSNAGFITVNRKYGARLFFWFVKSLHNSTHAPVIVWLQGQPGWSSLVGLFEEHGPYQVVETETGIQIELREHAWTNEFNVLYLDHCIGCGYSTAMRKAAYEPTFEMVSANVYQALVQFFGVFSEYADNEVYLAGEHGCAKYIPVIADTIHSKNALQHQQINLRGILIGGPYIDAVSMTSYSEYLYVIGLIDEQEHENLFIQEQYAKSLILATKYSETITYLKQNVYNKFERAGYQRPYDLRYEKPAHGHYTFERYMQKVVKYEPFVSSIHTEGLQFRTQSELLIEEIMKPVDNVLTTILQHYKVLYYNGQFDMLTPYSLTARYFSKLHWAQTDLFYSSQLNNWHATHSGYPDGYWKYSSNLTHIMIRDAGHTVGTTKPLTLLNMLKWFVSGMFETSYAPPSPDQRYLNIFI